MMSVSQPYLIWMCMAPSSGYMSSIISVSPTPAIALVFPTIALHVNKV